MNAEKLVKVSDYYIDENTRDIMISSRHFPIISGLGNANDEEIQERIDFYINYEKEYAKPINRVKRLIRKCYKR